MVYEWDTKKAASNLRKHGVAFLEASTVFLDPLALTFPDPDHSEYEQRFITIGQSRRGRMIFVAHADEGEHIRVISARKATRQEMDGYAEKR